MTKLLTIEDVSTMIGKSISWIHQNKSRTMKSAKNRYNFPEAKFKVGRELRWEEEQVSSWVSKQVNSRFESQEMAK